jgi:hypothetical protein
MTPAEKRTKEVQMKNNSALSSLLAQGVWCSAALALADGVLPAVEVLPTDPGIWSMIGMCLFLGFIMLAVFRFLFIPAGLILAPAAIFGPLVFIAYLIVTPVVGLIATSIISSAMDEYLSVTSFWSGKLLLSLFLFLPVLSFKLKVNTQPSRPGSAQPNT